MIQAALNGNRSRETHAAVPWTPADLAREARLAVAAGAEALHVHPHGVDGRESLAAADVTATLSAIRAACPGVPVGVSTGAWIEPDLGQRLGALAAWSGIDYASVNFDEPGAEEAARILLGRGIGVEAGLDSVEAGRRFVAFDRARACLRVLIELSDTSADVADATARAIEALLDGAEISLPRLLHGTDRSAWPMIEAAGTRGYDTRVGFEDTITLPDGALALSNSNLVDAAVHVYGRAWQAATAGRGRAPR